VTEPLPNQAPVIDVVAPVSALLDFTDSEVTQTLRVQATDPEDSDVTFQGEVTGPAGATLTVAQTGPQSAALTFKTSAPGSYTVRVYATDPENLRSPSVVVPLTVTRPLPPAPVDADGDGYPDGIDCNDADATIHPGKPDICANGIDEDCSGADRLASECDADGDGFIGAADCDDLDAARFPGASERCNGVDDNCDNQVDEGFSLGGACQLGVGACAQQGETLCGARGGVVCSAIPGIPGREDPGANTCDDGIDNDCDGQTDEEDEDCVDAPADAGVPDEGDDGDDAEDAGP
jgi:hypothetical protein